MTLFTVAKSEGKNQGKITGQKWGQNHRAKKQDKGKGKTINYYFAEFKKFHEFKK